MLRFATSPTRDMNIGDLRVALFNYILSKQLKEELLIRIDDTNKQKNIEGQEKEIQEILNLFSIDYSRVVAQSENIKYHTGMGMKLLLDKKAFNCFCSDEALENDRKKAKKEGKPYSYSGFCETISDEAKFQCNAPFVVRLKKPKKSITFTDVLQGDLEFTPDEVDSMVILDHNKSPNHNFACAVDDMLYDISLILRDEKHLDDTPKQIHIRESLGYDKQIKYVHIPKITNQQATPLPKVKDLIDDGFLPAAIANYLVLLGNKTPTEFFTLEEAIEWFSLESLSKTSVEFDFNKLRDINQKHLEVMDEMRLSKLLGFADEDIGQLGKLYLQEVSTLNEIKTKIDAVFSKKEPLSGFEDEFKLVYEALQKAPYFEAFDDLKAYVTEQTNLKENALLEPLKYILTGAKKGPNLSDVYPLIKNYIGEIVK